MSRSSQEFPSNQKSEPGSGTLVVSLEMLDRTALPLAGGKAANLGELIQAGFSVPAGFCITTAAYERVAAHAELDSHLLELEASERLDSSHRRSLLLSINRRAKAKHCFASLERAKECPYEELQRFAASVCRESSRRFKPPSPNLGVLGRSKDRLPDSNCSNARYMDGLILISYVCAWDMQHELNSTKPMSLAYWQVLAFSACLRA